MTVHANERPLFGCSVIASKRAIAVPNLALDLRYLEYAMLAAVHGIRVMRKRQSELVIFRNYRAKIGETNHQVKGYQRTEETECCECEELVFFLGRYHGPVSRLFRRLNAKREGPGSCKNEGKEKNERITHSASPLSVTGQ